MSDITSNYTEDNTQFTKHSGYSVEPFKEFMYWIPRFSSRRREEYIRVLSNRFINLSEKIVHEQASSEIKKQMYNDLAPYEDFLLFQRTDEELAFYEELVGNEYVAKAIDELFEACEKLKNVLGIM